MVKEIKYKGYQAKTEEQANHICKVFHYKGLKWRNGDSYLKDNYWRYYEDQTVYFPIWNKYVTVEWCNVNGVKVLPYDELKITKTYIMKYYFKKFKYLLILIGLALIALLFTSCSNEMECNCEKLTYSKTVVYEDEISINIPSGVMDTVFFKLPIDSTYYSDNCEDQNKVFNSDYTSYRQGSDFVIIFNKEIVKCR